MADHHRTRAADPTTPASTNRDRSMVPVFTTEMYEAAFSTQGSHPIGGVAMARTLAEARQQLADMLIFADPTAPATAEIIAFHRGCPIRFAGGLEYRQTLDPASVGSQHSVAVKTLAAAPCLRLTVRPSYAGRCFHVMPSVDDGRTDPRKVPAVGHAAAQPLPQDVKEAFRDVLHIDFDEHGEAYPVAMATPSAGRSI